MVMDKSIMRVRTFSDMIVLQDSSRMFFFFFFGAWDGSHRKWD